MYGSAEEDLLKMFPLEQQNIFKNIFSGKNLDGLANECTKMSETLSNEDLDLAITNPNEFMNKYIAQIFTNSEIKNVINNCIKKK